MRKAKNKLVNDFVNPFLGPNREELWKKLRQNSKPVSKEELLKRAEALRKKSSE